MYYYCKMLLVALLAVVLVDRCHSAILWQPRNSSPCGEQTSDTLDIPADQARQHNIVHLRQPLATMLFKPDIFYPFDEWLTNRQQLERTLTEANIVRTDKPERHHHHHQQQQKHHYTKCQYTKSMPVRHARAIDLRDERTRPINKRRTAVSDLTLCHFKICNMGRKRTTRYFHMIDELAHEN